MAIIEVNGILNVKDKNGNLNMIYPVTKAKNVEGLEEMKVTTDSELSATSTNPVQNKVIKSEIDKLKPTRVTVSLPATGWTQDSATGLYKKTVTVSGVSATETAQMIHVTPAVASQAAYMDAGIYASGQAANSLTFSASAVPAAALTVYVVIETL